MSERIEMARGIQKGRGLLMLVAAVARFASAAGGAASG
jgi:hypothetical protein